MLILVAIFASGLYVFTNLQGLCKANCSVQVFVVPQGASLNEVLSKLEKEKIIKNALVAKIYLKIKKINNNIQAGDFKLNPKDNIDKIIATLQKGTLDFWVTIPEGYRAEQVYEKIQFNRTDTFKGGSFKGKYSNLKIEEVAILRTLIRFQEVVLASASAYSPNLLCNYLYDLAQKFNTFYNADKIIGSENEDFRLALTFGVGQVLKNGLKLLGIESPDRM